MAIVKVNVTQKHIDIGVPKDCKYCPIAFALRDLGFKHFDVGVISINIFESAYGDVKRINLPKNVGSFIQDFDAGREVKPFEFELDIPTLS
jgi:hypothetical protein